MVSIAVILPNAQTQPRAMSSAKSDLKGAARVIFHLDGRRIRHGFLPFWDSFAHESFKLTARLNTSLPGVESLSGQKYPCRSN